LYSNSPCVCLTVMSDECRPDYLVSVQRTFRRPLSAVFPNALVRAFDTIKMTGFDIVGPHVLQLLSGAGPSGDTSSAGDVYTSRFLLVVRSSPLSRSLHRFNYALMIQSLLGMDWKLLTDLTRINTLAARPLDLSFVDITGSRVSSHCVFRVFLLDDYTYECDHGVGDDCDCDSSVPCARVSCNTTEFVPVRLTREAALHLRGWFVSTVVALLALSRSDGGPLLVTLDGFKLTFGRLQSWLSLSSLKQGVEPFPKGKWWKGMQSPEHSRSRHFFVFVSVTFKYILSSGLFCCSPCTLSFFLYFSKKSTGLLFFVCLFNHCSVAVWRQNLTLFWLVKFLPSYTHSLSRPRVVGRKIHWPSMNVKTWNWQG
jgi:hypothetical protein